MNFFAEAAGSTQVRRICSEHTEVFPTERYTILATDQERLRAITVLEQKARALEAEILEKQRAERDAFRLAAIVESSDDAIVSKDLNGIVTSWNRAAERIFGYKAEEIVGQSITLIIPPELHDDEPRILQRIQSGQKIDHFQTVRLTKDGRRIDVALTISPVKDREGRIIGAAKIARDIAGQRKIEEAALRLAAIVESSDDAIVSKDLNGIVTSWNKGAERIFGFKAEEIVGRSITLIIPPELQDDEPRILAKIRAGERIEHFETIRVRKNGERLNVSLTVSPVRNQQGQVIGAAKIARDVTHQKKVEAALQVSEKLASVGRLAATVAHEINNPLEAVTNYIYLAKSQPDLSDKLRRYLEYADQELVRVAHIAQQTLGFYRDNSLPVKIVVADAIQDVLTVYDRRFKYKDLRVECALEPDLTAWTLQGEFKQIVSNLIANSIDASREGGKILIRARNSREFRSGQAGVRITIADYGTGISEKDKARLFSPFFTTKQEVGTGLGLWITKDLLEKKGGHIRFRSRDSKPSGTVMSVYLPLKSKSDIAKVAA
jgi:PAS domain S-box-containing protein